MEGVADNLARLATLWACPKCAGEDLRLLETELVCSACRERYPLRDGIPLFGRVGGVRELGIADSGVTSLAYQDLFMARPAAPTPRHWRARLRYLQRRRGEETILRSLLAPQGRCATLLDLPCGGMARLSGTMGAFAELLIEADVSFEQVRADRECFPATLAGAWMTASVFHIPLRDAAVDGAVCARLAHHLPSQEEVARALAELLRVARRFVVFSFADGRAPKRLWRHLRGRPEKICYTSPERIRELAARHGARYARDRVWSPLGSRHIWALLLKEQELVPGR